MYGHESVGWVNPIVARGRSSCRKLVRWQTGREKKTKMRK